jgi:hypothetical protein
MFASDTLPFREQEIDHRDGQDVDHDLPPVFAMQRLGAVAGRDGLLVRERGVRHRGSPFERSGGETRARKAGWDNQ